MRKKDLHHFIFVCIIALIIFFAATPIEAASQKKGRDTQKKFLQKGRGATKKVSTAFMPFQGVWEFDKRREPSDFSDRDSPIIEKNIAPEDRRYLLFVQDKVCESNVLLGTEALCLSGYQPFDGKSISLDTFSGGTRLQNGQLELFNLSEKGGSLSTLIFIKIGKKAEPLEDHILSKKEMKRKEGEMKKLASSILANFDTWKQKLEDDGETVGVALSSETLKKKTWGGFESYYRDLYKWTDRAKKELKGKNYRLALHYASLAQEAYLQAQAALSQWRFSYEQNKRAEKDRAEANLPPKADISLLSSEVQGIQGAWQIDRYVKFSSDSEEWEEQPLTADETYGGNYYLAFAGNLFCATGSAHSPENPSSPVVCSTGYSPFTFDGKIVSIPGLQQLTNAQSLSYTAGLFELFDSDFNEKFIFHKTERVILTKE